MRTLTPQPTLVDQVYESILTGITEGRLGLDSRLIQAELAKTLGVSRQPVRQTLLFAHASEVLAGRLEQHLNQNQQPPAKTLRRGNLVN